jgi:hypothetical protein
MRGRIAFALCFSLAAVGCSGSAPPTQPTSLPSSLATIPSGSALEAWTTAYGNSDAAQRCLDYQNLFRADGTGFRNIGECVKYAAQGGTFGGGLIIYTLNVSGTEIGDFGWSLATTGFITTTTSFNSLQSRSSSAGCTISSVTINNPSSANPFVETFFSPGCPGGGLLWTEFAQTFWNAGPFASTDVYVPQGVVSPVWRVNYHASVGRSRRSRRKLVAGAFRLLAPEHRARGKVLIVIQSFRDVIVQIDLGTLIDNKRLARDGQRRGSWLTGDIGLDLVDDRAVAGSGGPADHGDPGDAARRDPRAIARGLDRHVSSPARGIERLTGRGYREAAGQWTA